MKNLYKIAAVLTVGTLLVTGAFAQGKKPAAKPKAKPAMHKMAKAVNCPVCKMPLAMKKSKADPVAVNVKGKTMYCCAACKMPASMMAKKMGHKKPMMKKPMGKKK